MELYSFSLMYPAVPTFIVIACENPQALGLPLLSFKEKLVRLLGPGKE